MRLLMYLRNELIDSIYLEHKKVTLPGYVGSFIRLLKEKHNQILSQSIEEPQFLVQNKAHPSKRNLRTS